MRESWTGFCQTRDKEIPYMMLWNSFLRALKKLKIWKIHSNFCYGKKMYVESRYILIERS